MSVLKEPEVVSPLLIGEEKAVDADRSVEDSRSPRKRPSIRRPGSKRLSGRASIISSPLVKSGKHSYPGSESTEQREASRGDRGGQHHLDHLIDQVSSWIKDERTKRAERKPNHHSTDGTVESKDHSTENDTSDLPNGRRGSDSSETSFNLNKLEVSLNVSMEMFQLASELA